MEPPRLPSRRDKHRKPGRRLPTFFGRAEPRVELDAGASRSEPARPLTPPVPSHVSTEPTPVAPPSAADKAEPAPVVPPPVADKAEPAPVVPPPAADKARPAPRPRGPVRIPGAVSPELQAIMQRVFDPSAAAQQPPAGAGAAPPADDWRRPAEPRAQERRAEELQAEGLPAKELPAEELRAKELQAEGLQPAGRPLPERHVPAPSPAERRREELEREVLLAPAQPRDARGRRVTPAHRKYIYWRRRLGALLVLLGLLVSGASLGLLARADWQPALLTAWRHYEPSYLTVDGSGIAAARIQGDHWERVVAGAWAPVTWRGVVYSHRVPALSLLEHPDTGATLADFQAISELQANLLIVPGLQPPSFYRALAAWNRRHPEPLYLLQVLRPATTQLTAAGTLDDPTAQAALADEVAQSLNALAGRLDLPPSVDGIGGTYEWDVRPYLAGIALDMPWQRLLTVAGAAGPPWQRTLDRVAELTAAAGIATPLGFWAPPELMLANPPALTAAHGFFYLPVAAPGTLGFAQAAAVRNQADLTPAQYITDLRRQRPEVVMLPVVGERVGAALVRFDPKGWVAYSQSPEQQATALAADLAALRESRAGVAVLQYADDWSETAYGTADLRIPPSRRGVWFDPLTGADGLTGWQPSDELQTLAPHETIAAWERLGHTPLLTAEAPVPADPYGSQGGEYRRLERIYAHAAASGLDVLVKLNALPGPDAWRETHLLLALDLQPGGNTNLPYPNLPTYDTGWERVVEVGAQGVRVWVAARQDPVTWLWGEQRKLLPVPAGADREQTGQWIPAVLPVAPALQTPGGVSLPLATLDLGQAVDWAVTTDGQVRLHIPWLALGVLDPSGAGVPEPFWDTGKLVVRSARDEAPDGEDGIRLAALTYRPGAEGAPARVSGGLAVASSLPAVVDGHLPYWRVTPLPWRTWDETGATPVRRPAFTVVAEAFAAWPRP
jgi:hypothetical protein